MISLLIIDHELMKMRNFDLYWRLQSQADKTNLSSSDEEKQSPMCFLQVTINLAEMGLKE